MKIGKIESNKIWRPYVRRGFDLCIIMGGIEFATDCIAGFENFHLALVALNRETERNLDYRFIRTDNKLVRLTQFFKPAFS